MNQRLLVLDLDGTLLTTEKKISDRTKQALFALMDAGHKIALASGRPVPGILPVADELNMEERGGYILSFNGARIVDACTKEVVFQQVLSHSFLPALYDAAVRYGLCLFTYEGNRAISATTVSKYGAFEAKINHLTIEEVSDFPKYVNFPINKCLYSGDPKDIKRCEDELLLRFGNELSIFKSEDFFLEIMAHGIDKAASVDRLIKKIGIKREDVVCCGDSYNDCSMIEYAGVGVAMANGKDAAKDVADVIAGSNDEDGLVPIIEEYFLKHPITTEK